MFSAVEMRMENVRHINIKMQEKTEPFPPKTYWDICLKTSH